MQDFTIRKQEEEDRVKEMDRQREEQRRVQAAQQVEQQRLYKQDLQHSYKSMLDNQLGQQRMQKEIAM